jgi:ABC-type spermidine/putrescine transport system permease subunit II
MKTGRNRIPHLLLALFSLYIVLPPLWVLRTSFVPDSLAYQTSLFPDLTLANYIKLFAKDEFALAYQDSLMAALGSTLLALPLAAMTGYAFARFRTGGQASRFIVLATQMLPPVAIVLPVFAIFRLAGLTNSVAGLMIAYAAINLPFLTWILMGFFEGVPVELEWAAMTDGATAWGAFWRIVIPVSARACRRRRARIHPGLERVPVRPGADRTDHGHDPSGSVGIAIAERRADCGSVCGRGAGRGAAAHRLATDPEISRQRLDLWRDQVRELSDCRPISKPGESKLGPMRVKRSDKGRNP